MKRKKGGIEIKEDGWEVVIERKYDGLKAKGM